MEIIKQTIDKQEVELVRKTDVEKEISTIVESNDEQVNQLVRERDKALKGLEKCATMLEEMSNKIRAELL